MSKKKTSVGQERHGKKDDREVSNTRLHEEMSRSI